MKLQKENLGKVAITIDKDYWDVNKDYDKLVVVQVKDKFATYVSRKPVPMGTDITDREYWIPFSSLKEDILLDYNSFLERYGEELAFLHENIDRIDEIMSASENIMATHDKIKEDAEYIRNNAEYLEFLYKRPILVCEKNWPDRYPFFSNNNKGVSMWYKYLEGKEFKSYIITLGLAGTDVNENSGTHHFNNGLVKAEERLLLINKNSADGVVVLDSVGYIPNNLLDYGFEEGMPLNAGWMAKTWHTLGVTSQSLEHDIWDTILIKDPTTSMGTDNNMVFEQSSRIALTEAMNYMKGSVHGLGRTVNAIAASLGIRDIVNPLAWDLVAEIPQASMQINGTYIKSDMTAKRAIATLDKNAADRSAEIKQLRADVPGIVDTKIAEIVGAAPETLDTLEEIANKLHDNDDIHQSILAAIGEKVSNTTYTNYITQAERAMTAMNDKITELEGKLLVFESGAKLSLSISPSVIYKNTATNITVTGKLNSSVELGDVALQLNGFAQIATGTNTVTKTESINDSNNTKTFTLKANVKGVQLTTSASLQLRNAIYCGFGSTANNVIKVLNRLSARTSASGIYGGTNTIGDNKHYIICVPNDIPVLNNFTMGGAPYVMNHTTQTINEITYNIYTSGATYNNQALVEIIAS